MNIKKKYYSQKKIGTFLKPRLKINKSNKYMECQIMDDIHHHIIFSKKDFKIKYNLFKKIKSYALFIQIITNQLKKKNFFLILLDLGLLKFSKKIDFLHVYLKNENIYSN